MPVLISAKKKRWQHIMMYDLEAGCWFWSLAFKLNMNRKEGRMHGHEKVQCIHRESKECKRCYSNAQFFFLGQRAEDELCWNNQKELTANTGVNEPVKEAESQKGQNEGIKKILAVGSQGYSQELSSHRCMTWKVCFWVQRKSKKRF